MFLFVVLPVQDIIPRTIVRIIGIASLLNFIFLVVLVYNKVKSIDNSDLSDILSEKKQLR